VFLSIRRWIDEGWMVIRGVGVVEDDVLQRIPNLVPWLSFSSETLICGPHRSTPLVFSMRAVDQQFFFFIFCLFRPYQQVGPIVPQGSLRLTNTGVFLLHMQDHFRCYCMDVNRLAPESYIFSDGARNLIQGGPI
jgi:hypothetical protein